MAAKVENNIYRDGSPYNIVNSNEVNAAHEAKGGSAPYAPNTPVIQGIAPVGAQETQVISSDQKILINRGENATGRWSTTDNVPSQGYATNELAITTPKTLPVGSTIIPFKQDVDFTVMIETQQSTPYNKGIVGSQPGAAGGGNQTEWLYSPGSKDSYIQPIPSSIKPLPVVPMENMK